MILRSFARNILRFHRAPTTKPVDVAVCIDIECTCDSPIQIHPMELIEVACLKLDLTKLQKNGANKESCLKSCPTFHSFAKPVINPELTLFCQELTGVFQSTVDKADTVDRVTDKLLLWLIEQDIIDGNYKLKQNFAFASCGNFDLTLLSALIKEHKFNNNVELPIYFQEWINVKKTFVNHKKEWPKGLYHMLELLGEEPSGRLHSARDDCKNLARIVECLHADECKFHVTSRTGHNRYNSGNNNANNKL